MMADPALALPPAKFLQLSNVLKSKIAESVGLGGEFLCRSARISSPFLLPFDLEINLTL